MCGVYAYARIWQAYLQVSYDNRKGAGAWDGNFKGGDKVTPAIPWIKEFPGSNTEQYEVGDGSGGGGGYFPLHFNINPDGEFQSSRHADCNYPQLMKTTVQSIHGIRFLYRLIFVYIYTVLAHLDMSVLLVEKRPRQLVVGRLDGHDLVLTYDLQLKVEGVGHVAGGEEGPRPETAAV